MVEESVLVGGLPAGSPWFHIHGWRYFSKAGIMFPEGAARACALRSIPGHEDRVLVHKPEAARDVLFPYEEKGCCMKLQ
jgi:hypothetical protein